MLSTDPPVLKLHNYKVEDHPTDPTTKQPPSLRAKLALTWLVIPLAFVFLMFSATAPAQQVFDIANQATLFTIKSYLPAMGNNDLITGSFVVNQSPSGVPNVDLVPLGLISSVQLFDNNVAISISSATITSYMNSQNWTLQIITSLISHIDFLSNTQYSFIIDGSVVGTGIFNTSAVVPEPGTYALITSMSLSTYAKKGEKPAVTWSRLVSFSQGALVADSRALASGCVLFVTICQYILREDFLDTTRDPTAEVFPIAIDALL